MAARRRTRPVDKASRGKGPGQPAWRAAVAPAPYLGAQLRGLGSLVFAPSHVHVVRRGALVLAFALGLVSAVPEPALASGHGPVYGLATPTLGKGGWSLDLAVMGKAGEQDMAMTRPMLGYGITEDLQVSVSLPMPLYVPIGTRPARTMAMMPANRDVEVLLGWRFHRASPAVGARFESTAFVGLLYPTDSIRAGVRTAPGLYGAAVTGYASRTVYAWVGGLYRRYMTPTGETADHPGDLAMYSFVFGYRPGFFRKDYPHPDWRIFLEVVGEYTARDRVAGRELANTGGHQIFVGPTLLGLYGNWGISGGPVFRVYDDLNGIQPKDKLRVVVNFTYWF